MDGDADLPLEHVHVEPGAPSVDPAPAVFVLHGRGADEQDLLPVARHLPDALHVVSLRAPDPLMGGYTWYGIEMPDGDLHRSQPEPDDFRRSLDLVSETVEEGIDAYGLDPRVGLLGFSQGAIMGFSLLLEEPERVAWCVGLHGYLAESHADLEPEGIRGAPVFVGAGSADEIIPAGRAEAAADRFRELGCDVTFRSYAVGHGVGRDELDDVVAWVDDRLGE